MIKTDVISTPETAAYKELLKDYNFARDIATQSGFFSHYFNVMLPKYDTRIEAFNTLNKEYSRLFGDEKYTDYNSFRSSLKLWLNKQSNK